MGSCDENGAIPNDRLLVGARYGDAVHSGVVHFDRVHFAEHFCLCFYTYSNQKKDSQRTNYEGGKT